MATFLYAMANKEAWKKHYERIVRHIQVIMPQFGDFVLRPSSLNEDYIRLDWREKGRDYLFGPHQLSDGSLRFMALATLLLQPALTLPKVIILDEPELGLHPVAISSLAGMIRTASVSSQIVLATQSPRLVDEFNIDEVVIVERDEAENRSLFKRLDEKELSEWLERYSLSDLWERTFSEVDHDLRPASRNRGGPDGGGVRQKDFRPASRRFIPYIQLHEFEALILADVGKLDWEYLDHDAPIRRLVQMVGNRNPELINDTPDGAPSKRILHELPEYDKANSGVLVAEKIGLETMRANCSHFHSWLELLEGLAKTQ